jgi:hypothetical protein
MSDDKEGLSTSWQKIRKWPHWKLLGICIGMFLFGYIVGEDRALKNRDAMLEKMIKTNTINIGYDIPLGLTEEKRQEILGAMENAIEENRQGR